VSRRARASLALILALLPSPAGAAQWNLSGGAGALCVPSGELLDIERALANHQADLRILASERRNVDVRIQSRDYELTLPLPADTQYLATSAAYPSSGACELSNGAAQMPAHHRIPAAYLLAVANVVTYRAQHRWPLGAADFTAAQTLVDIAVYHGAILVMPFDPVQSKTPCAGEEYYRVDSTTFTVAPFDGCVDPHPPLTSFMQ